MKLSNLIVSALVLSAMPAAGQALDRPARIPDAGNSSYSTTLVGFITAADSWANLEFGQMTPFGIYTILPEEGNQPQKFARIGIADSYCTGGAVLAGDTYWYIWRQIAGGIDLSQLFSYNLTTAQWENHFVVDSSLATSLDMAYNLVDGKIYGQYVIDGEKKLCEVDFAKKTRKTVCDRTDYPALAFDAAGTLWGIDNSGNLCKIDIATGDAEKIGSTGVRPTKKQSMTFDPVTGVLYWTSFSEANSGTSALRTVDTSTGQSTLVTTFADREQFAGLGVMPLEADASAPGRVKDLKASFENGSAKGTVSFTMPSHTYLGDALSGSLTYKIYVNGEVMAEGTAQLGADISKELTLGEGEAALSVRCANNSGEGPAENLDLWIGQDYPLAPESVVYSIDESTGEVSLSWSASKGGRHGGYVNPSAVTYTVTRYPGAERVASGIKATSFSEIVEAPEVPVATWYEVFASNGSKEGLPVESNHINYGKGFHTPYVNTFDDASQLTLFTIIDGNEDKSTWKWHDKKTKPAYIFTGTDNERDQDDWLITPGISMRAGTSYEITYELLANMGGSSYKEKMEVAAGLGTNPAEFKIIQEAFAFDGSRTRSEKIVLTAEKDGYYHIGFHALSNCKDALSIELDNLKITAVPADDAPAGVRNLNLLTNHGTPPVKISFKAPEKTVGGDNLESIDRIEVYRNTNELVETIEKPEPGKQINVTDGKNASGNVDYAVVAYNEHGEGERVETSIYVGIDLPGRCTDITLTDAGDGKLQLTWKAPTAGANNGFYDPENLTYNVYKVEDGKAVLFKDRITECKLLFDEEDYDADRQFVKNYAVAAANSAGTGGIFISSEVMVGQCYLYPWAESWPVGEPSYSGWYYSRSGESSWRPVQKVSSDKDDGCLEFDAYEDGDMSYIFLGKVKMSTASQPKLIFDYYAYPGTSLYLVPEINLAYSGEYATTQGINFRDLTGDEGWRECVVDLGNFMSLPYISVRMLGKGDGTLALRIDNVRIMDSDKTPTMGFAGIDAVTDRSDVTYEFYDLAGFRVSRPVSGRLYIVRGSDGTARKIVY